MVLESAEPKAGASFVRCACECGRNTVVRHVYLKNGHTTSCGCRKAEARAEALARRRLVAVTGTPEHVAWIAMIGRCHSGTNRNFHNYGARGIRVCPEWRTSFHAFLSHVGHRPSKAHSIDRIDNNRGYEPGNVRWATMAQQQNNKRGLRLLTYNGETLPLMSWARRFGLPQPRLHQRIVTLGWDLHRAFTEPIRKYHR